MDEAAPRRSKAHSRSSQHLASSLRGSAGQAQPWAVRFRLASGKTTGKTHAGGNSRSSVFSEMQPTGRIADANHNNVYVPNDNHCTGSRHAPAGTGEVHGGVAAPGRPAAGVGKFSTFAAVPLVLTPFVRNQRRPSGDGDPHRVHCSTGRSGVRERKSHRHTLPQGSCARCSAFPPSGERAATVASAIGHWHVPFPAGAARLQRPGLQGFIPAGHR